MKTKKEIKKNKKMEPTITTNSQTTQQKKIKIYWDIDDVIIESLRAIYDNLLNFKYDSNPLMQAIDWPSDEVLTELINDPNKGFYSHKDWNMRCIARNLNTEAIDYMFTSKIFWDTVKINPAVIDMVKNGTIGTNGIYDNYFITKGGDNHGIEKKKFLNDHSQCEGDLEGFFDENKYTCYHHGHDKSETDMSLSEEDKKDGYIGTIQIDDNLRNLVKGNADIKILVKNLIETEYNTGLNSCKNKNSSSVYNDYVPTMDNLYIVNDMYDVKELLEKLQDSEDFRDVFFNKY